MLYLIDYNYPFSMYEFFCFMVLIYSIYDFVISILDCWYVPTYKNVHIVQKKKHSIYNTGI
jgi:hypothetical protein